MYSDISQINQPLHLWNTIDTKETIEKVRKSEDGLDNY
jgi:hypothetical protein